MSDSITSFIGLKDSDADYCQEVIRKNDNTDHHLIYVRLSITAACALNAEQHQIPSCPHRYLLL